LHRVSWRHLEDYTQGRCGYWNISTTLGRLGSGPIDMRGAI
jgi:hypothetical protein